MPSRATKTERSTERLTDARRRLLADWCRLVGQRLADGEAAATLPAVLPTPTPPRRPARAKPAAGRSIQPADNADSSAAAAELPPPPMVRPSPPAISGLAPRARQVLDRLLAGDAEKQVAAKLAISPHTVHTYVKQLHKTLGVSSRGELLAKFVHRDLSDR